MTAIAEYLASKQVTTLAPATQQLYSSALGKLREFCVSEQVQENAKDIARKIDAFAEHLRNRNLSGKSAQQYMTVAKIFLKASGAPVDYAFRIDHDDRKATQLKHERRWFDENDIAKCLAYIFEEYPGDTMKLKGIVLVRLLLDTGARIGELCAVTPDDVSLEDRMLWLGESKTIPRPAFYSEETKIRLSRLIDLHTKIKESTAPLLFDKRVAKNMVNLMLTKLGIKNGKDGRGPHTFRHYVASRLFYRGKMSLHDIATLLGDKPETIRDSYLHPTPLILREMVDRAMGWEF
jgi:integrase